MKQQKLRASMLLMELMFLLIGPSLPSWSRGFDVSSDRGRRKCASL